MSLIILVAGASGSGKSTVVEHIIQTLGQDICDVIPLDMFYRDRSDISDEEKPLLNYDHPDAIDWETLYQTIDDIKTHRQATLPYYDFNTHTRIVEKTRIFTTKPIIIVEGIMVLYPEDLRQKADYRIFVETPLDICLGRRLQRDTASKDAGGRGRSYKSVITQWQTVRDMYLTHFEPTKLHADLILPRGTRNEKGIQLVIAALTHLLEQKNSN